MSFLGPNGQILISHRGNISGRIIDQENDPAYIQTALDQGYEVEIDVWVKEDTSGIFLGHDAPEHFVKIDFVRQPGLWCHAKNFLALNNLLSLNVQCFYHSNDNYTLTSTGWIWAYPGQPGNKRSIAVMPE